MTTSPRFDKYELMGAYHWAECERLSPRYNPPLVARYQVVADRVGANERALDLGCGDGYLLGQIAGRCTSAVGIEFESVAVQLAAKLLSGFPACTVLQGSVYDLPFPSREFDVAVMSDVIEHLEDPDRAAREAARVIKDDGRFLVTTPKWRPDRRWDPRHVQEFRPEELVACVGRHFADVRLTYFWPLRWSNWYSTRVGWKLLKWYARILPNPFLREGEDPREFGQILAVCRLPLR